MANASLKRSALGFFIGAMCLMYPQQIGGFAMNIVSFIVDIFVKAITGQFLKAIGI